MREWRAWCNIIFFHTPARVGRRSDPSSYAPNTNPFIATDFNKHHAHATPRRGGETKTTDKRRSSCCPARHAAAVARAMQSEGVLLLVVVMMVAG